MQWLEPIIGEARGTIGVTRRRNLALVRLHSRGLGGPVVGGKRVGGEKRKARRAGHAIRFGHGTVARWMIASQERGNVGSYLGSAAWYGPSCGQRGASNDFL